MNSLNKIFIGIFIICLLLSGCLQILGKTNNQNTTKEPSINASITPPITQNMITFNETKNYSKLSLAFKYPKNFEWEEKLNGYNDSKGYASVLFSGPQNTYLLVTYFYTGNLDNISQIDPYDFTASNLQSEVQAQTDPLGILQFATNVSDISNVDVGTAKGAFMKFIALRKNVKYYGVAMSIYAQENQVLYGVRVYSASPDMADALTNQFVSTVKFYPQNKTGALEAPQSINSSINTSNAAINVIANQSGS